MAWFHIFLRGEHFLIQRDGKEEWLGFYKNIYLQAATPDSAMRYLRYIPSFTKFYYHTIN